MPHLGLRVIALNNPGLASKYYLKFITSHRHGNSPHKNRGKLQRRLARAGLRLDANMLVHAELDSLLGQAGQAHIPVTPLDAAVASGRVLLATHIATETSDTPCFSRFAGRRAGVEVKRMTVVMVILGKLE